MVFAALAVLIADPFLQVWAGSGWDAAIDRHPWSLALGLAWLAICLSRVVPVLLRDGLRGFVDSLYDHHPAAHYFVGVIVFGMGLLSVWAGGNWADWVLFCAGLAVLAVAAVTQFRKRPGPTALSDGRRMH